MLTSALKRPSWHVVAHLKVSSYHVTARKKCPFLENYTMPFLGLGETLCIKAKEGLMTHASYMRIRYCRCFFLMFASTCSISLFSFKFCLLSAFLLYSIRMLANLYKRLTITTNALLLIRMACNCFRICCAYAFLTEFRNMILIFAILLERSECLRIRMNFWR